MKQKIAHCIHHTHWDLIWYFTVQDAHVQFSYNMKELLKGFREGKIENFFLDGQTAPIDDYLLMHPDDTDEIKELVSSGRLMIGPFNSQLDCFISNGESVINNLRLGHKTGSKLGATSKIAYLPDSFGHSYDFPKIFNKFGIHDFVITRGVGDEYDLPSEFYMESNDGSKLLVAVMIAGYGYGCYAFKEGNLFETSAEDYNKISVESLINRLLCYSTLEDEFVFPLGFDQNPAILNIPEQIAYYNDLQEEIKFELTTWQDFLNRVRAHGSGLKTHKYELFSTQYHRVHKSIFSGRADIKALQDRCERLLTYELQPIMSMLDSLGIDYDHGIIDQAWEKLVKAQTHSTANLTDETNNFIMRETQNAVNIANAAKVYLMKLVSISMKRSDRDYLVVFNTLPVRRKLVQEVKILAKAPVVKIVNEDGIAMKFSVIQCQKKNHGVLRKNVELIDESKFYYEIDIILETDEFKGISYKTYKVVTGEESSYGLLSSFDRFIENDRYKVYQEETGITVYDKKLNTVTKQAVHLENMGDEGDSYDYSYPNYDMTLLDYFDGADIDYQICDQMSMMTLKGGMQIPHNLKSRKKQVCEDTLSYEIKIILKKDSDHIEVEGTLQNTSKQHRVRLVFTGHHANKHSYAGTQFGYIERETHPVALDDWRENNYFEEPSPTFPLLNHVSMVSNEHVKTLFTRSSKEYELIGEGFKDLAITLFRSYDALGNPDLNRRPGRPSGLDYMVFETFDTEMIGENKFSLALSQYDKFDANQVTNDYVLYACESSYYQKQDYDKSIDAISYFPTNPTPHPLPSHYEFLELSDFEGSFGSLVKSNQTDNYILRLYNNKNETCTGGKLSGYSDEKSLQTTDFLEESIEEITADLTEMNQGELRLIRIPK